MTKDEKLTAKVVQEALSWYQCYTSGTATFADKSNVDHHLLVALEELWWHRK